MGMTMVAVIVPMAVRVPQGHVGVLVGVPFLQREEKSGSEARRGEELDRLDRLTENGPRKEGPEERSRGEEQLGTRGAQLL